MGQKHTGVDSYIATAPDFAKPILRHIRAAVHAAVPEVVEELKWSHPAFTYKGMLCGMAAFKEHCSLSFWKGAMILDKASGKPLGLGAGASFARVTAMSDLPSTTVLTAYLEEAKRLNDEDVKAPMGKPAPPKPKLSVPPEFMAALKKNKKSLSTFEKFSPSHKREYVEWITEAKMDATREKRIATAIEWLAEGKPRNWKYKK